MATGIISDAYRAEYAALAADPIIIAMAAGVAPADRADLFHEGGTPEFTFMLAANREYHARGGQLSQSIGGVAHGLAIVWGL